MRALFFVAVGAIGITLGPAQIVLDQDFDSGSLDVGATTIDTSMPASPLITLEPRRFAGSWAGNHWWVSFRISGVAGLRPRFRIPTANAFQGYSNTHRWVFSATPNDPNSWFFFDNGALNGTFYEFSNNAAFATGSLTVALGLPYPTSRTANDTLARIGNPFVTPTASADARLVVGRTLGTAGGGYTDDLGRAVPALDLYGYRITDPQASGPKHKIVVATGNHSGESTGTWTVHGFVEFALGPDPAAAQLRQLAEIFIYPQCDPEGRYSGYFRSNPENPTRNHNRFWHDPTGFTDLTILSNAMRTDAGADVDFFLDFHSYGSASGIGYFAHSANTETSRFLSALHSLEPAVSDFGSVGNATPGIAGLWASTTGGLCANVAVSPESGYLANQGVARYLLLGENYARAVLAAILSWPAPASPRSEDVFVQQVQALQPALHLRLNETGAASGQVAADASGNARHGTYFGPVELGEEDPFRLGDGSAAKFEGTAQSVGGEYVRVPDFEYGNVENELTVGFWFKTADISGVDLQYMWSHGMVSQPNSLNIYFVEESHASGLGNRLRTVFLDADDPTGTANALDISPAPADGEWHLYAFVYAADKGAAVFLDGIEMVGNSSIGGGPFDPATAIHVAAREDLSTVRFYGHTGADDGLLDEVMVFDHALDSAALAALFASPMPLSADRESLSLSLGGTQTLILEAGASWSNTSYWMLGSVSGTSPGVPIGPLTLPLNPDFYTVYTMQFPNMPPLGQSVGRLDGNGHAQATVTIPPGLPLTGWTVHHAYVLSTTNPVRFAFTSNAVSLTFEN